MGQKVRDLKIRLCRICRYADAGCGMGNLPNGPQEIRWWMSDDLCQNCATKLDFRP